MPIDLAPLHDTHRVLLRIRIGEPPLKGDRAFRVRCVRLLVRLAPALQVLVEERLNRGLQLLRAKLLTAVARSGNFVVSHLGPCLF